MSNIMAFSKTRTRRSPAMELLLRVSVAVAFTVTAVLIFMNPWRHSRPDRHGWIRVPLVRKDTAFHPVDGDGATGSVSYRAQGATFPLRAALENLDPAKRVLLELDVDGTVYDVASYQPTRDGKLSIDTTLSQFAEGTCVGPNFDAPRPLAGRHSIKFWVKRDGNPKSGTEQPPAPWSGGTLSCSGNGDGDYTYLLLEGDIATFTGDSARAKR
jgi:hypothetical protein